MKMFEYLNRNGEQASLRLDLIRGFSPCSESIIHLHPMVKSSILIDPMGNDTFCLSSEPIEDLLVRYDEISERQDQIEATNRRR